MKKKLRDRMHFNDKNFGQKLTLHLLGHIKRFEFE